jgi:DNA-binding transcriptional MerR regulator
MGVETGTYMNGRRNGKSAAAFRTISEVAGDLDVPPHVLRFWETKFSQVRPLKRGGGRRYYRPEDVGLLMRIRELLYSDGYTIKGVQRLLRDGVGKPLQDESDAGFVELPISELEPMIEQSATATGGLGAKTRSELAGVLDELLALRKKLVDACR